MTLLANIKANQLQARRDKAALATSLLTTLIGEVETKSKNENRELTDAEVTAVIQKFLKGINESIGFIKQGGATDEDERIVTLNSEKQILEAYLPKQLNEEEILNALSGQEKNKGKLMAFLKSNFAGQYDGKVAAKVVDQYIAS